MTLKTFLQPAEKLVSNIDLWIQLGLLVGITSFIFGLGSSLLWLLIVVLGGVASYGFAKRRSRLVDKILLSAPVGSKDLPSINVMLNVWWLDTFAEYAELKKRLAG